MSHVTKIPRKPKWVGTEIKNPADGMSGVMLKLEIEEGKDTHHNLEYGYLPFGTAITLRLTKKYFNTNRIDIGDSAFSSVETLKNLRDNGLYFMGIVKTAHNRFPKQYLTSQLQNSDIGSFIICNSSIPNYDDEEMYALGWKDMLSKIFITIIWTTDDGNPIEMVRNKILVEVDNLVDSTQNYIYSTSIDG